jgi:cellulose synthase/poly-beta-1,6-N-acetylglucosamine synthase-like glycosyltransferase
MNIKNTQMKNIAISVIIPIYNAELFLNETIDSVLSQTFADFELQKQSASNVFYKFSGRNSCFYLKITILMRVLLASIEKLGLLCN